MICCTVINRSKDEILDILGKVEMAEIRLDLCRLSDEEIEEIFTNDTPLVATCRAGKDGDFRETERKLMLAINAGAHYADLEIEAPGSVSRRIRRSCMECGTVLIRSFHDYESTPDMDSLREMVDKCRNMGGDIVKIVTTATKEEDADCVLDLYKYYSPECLIAFAMGESGRASRTDCLLRGAPFTYACLDRKDSAAPGQPAYEELYSETYGSRKPVSPSKPLRMPASKSFAQRAVLAASLAEGVSRLKSYTPCGDSEATIRAAEVFGARVSRQKGDDGTEILEVEGRKDDACAPAMVNVGESGLLARLAIPLCAQISGAAGTLVEACGTLTDRVLEGAGFTMDALGARLMNSDGRPVEKDITLPVKVAGPLRGGYVTLDGSRSSQLISGALMALPLAARNSTLVVKNPTSIPYIYITMDILRRFGIKTRSQMFGGRQLLDEDWSRCDSIEIKVKENQRYKACDMTLEADWSAAAVFLAAGAIFGQVGLEGLDTSSIQADIMMLDILMDAGASLSQLDEPRGMITVKKAPLRAIEADLSNSPDLFPVVAVLCAFCQGTSRLAGIRRLAHKESDRAVGIMDMLGKLGVTASVKGDVMCVGGQSYASRILSGHLLKGGEFSSYHDHRMVMALSLAALGADGPIDIDDRECVAKSFPGFNQVWKEL